MLGGACAESFMPPASRSSSLNLICAHNMMVVSSHRLWPSDTAVPQPCCVRTDREQLPAGLQRSSLAVVYGGHFPEGSSMAQNNTGISTCGCAD